MGLLQDTCPFSYAFHCSIGDWYPERNIFQILIAITSGPRFALVFLQYFITRTSHSAMPGWVFLTGLVRTLACGGWVYVTSNDHHDAHDVLMILYIVCNVPWMLGGIMTTTTNHVQVRRKRFVQHCSLPVSLFEFRPCSQFVAAA